MKLESVMVTGANRGIGLEFVRQLSRLSEPPKYIFATYRSPDSLKDLKELEESSTKTKIILIKMGKPIFEVNKLLAKGGYCEMSQSKVLCDLWSSSFLTGMLVLTVSHQI
ncbi:hypothetical protein AVEN_26969-1 [Araneus ventricosus]|uniref:Uncharacterized protein n=1 Tax=Araneus ventricosus TaxID=182803 RepID=A0A4Y2K561_ARAVE|nr:hypothetical protein AVEN_26969-1 [Araneus ventricosus]